jgi:transposase
LGSISKRGDRYLRSLLIHGARSVIQHLGGEAGPAQLLAKATGGPPWQERR